MWRIALLVLELIAPQIDARPVRPQEISCLGPDSIVGLSESFHIILFDGTRWNTSRIPDLAIELWRSPDNRIFVSTGGHVVFDMANFSGDSTRWRLPAGGFPPRLASLDGLSAITPDRIYKLEAGGVVKDVGATPASLGGRRPLRGPILIPSPEGLVACFGTSIREVDANEGHCIRQGPHGYHYAADFGDPGAVLGDIDSATPPFSCGDVIISTRKGGTQARHLSDGALIGRSSMAARSGSECLPDGRALIIGKHDVGLFDVPRLHRLWRRDLKGAIRSAVLCGSRIAVLLEKNPSPVLIDIPPP